MYLYYVYIVSSKPTLKKLQQTKIITDVGSKWFELGIELLDEDQSTQLDIIKTNNNEVTRRCGEMFLFWLNTHPNATWQNLVDALKAPGVELNDVAAKVETHFNVGLSASQSSGIALATLYNLICMCVYILMYVL